MNLATSPVQAERMIILHWEDGREFSVKLRHVISFIMVGGTVMMQGMGESGDFRIPLRETMTQAVGRYNSALGRKRS